MNFIRGLTAHLIYLLCLSTFAVSAMSIMMIDEQVFAAEQARYQCRQKLSKKGLIIFDEVQQKRGTSSSNLDIIWKEVSRDLITANILGREEATTPAMEALNCLRSPQ